MALLAAWKADAGRLMHGPDSRHLKAASDLAAESGHLGIAAFLGELQLQQGVCMVAERQAQGRYACRSEDLSVHK